jgi:hypothetical protein
MQWFVHRVTDHARLLAIKSVGISIEGLRKYGLQRQSAHAVDRHYVTTRI